MQQKLFGRNLLIYGLLAGWLWISPQPVLADAGGVTEAVLKNGLKVLIKTDNRAPVVVAQLWYRVGGSYEPVGLTGMSHVLEHMMFKGTKKYGLGEFDRIIAENGGSDNAFTSRDYTAYFQTLEKSRLPVSLELESDRMQNLLLDESEFAKELQVVIEERRQRTEDKPESKVYEKFMEAAYVDHPYGRPIIGWMRDLEKLTVADLRRWYQRYYVPNNATLVVVGDVEPAAVIAAASRYYGSIPAGPAAEASRIPPVKQSQPRRLVVSAPANVPYIVMGFHVPSLADARESDWEPYALQVLSAILDGGDAARFFNELIREQHVAAAISVDYDAYARLGGLLTIDGNPARGKTVEQLEAAVWQQLRRLQQAPVSDTELQRVKAQVIANDVYQRDSVFYQAMKLGMTETALGDWRISEASTERLKAVTAQQVMAVAKKYLQPDRVTVAVLDAQPVSPGKEQ